MLGGCGGGESAPESAPAKAAVHDNPVQAAAAVPRPTDVGPARLGRPVDSAKAAPIWALDGYAPLLVGDEAEAMWKATAATPAPGSIDRELLACEVDRAEASGRHPRATHVRVTFGGDPDPHALGGFGRRRDGDDDPPRASGDVTGRTRKVHFAIPLVSLNPADQLQLSIGDEELRIPFAGVPIVHLASTLGVQCRVVPAAARDEAVLDALWKTDRKLASLSATAVEDLGGARDIERAMRKAEQTLVPVAAMVGWDDARVRKRLDRVREVETKATGQLVVQLADVEAASAGGWVRIGPKFSARVDAMACEFGSPDDGHVPAYACEITMTIQNGFHDAMDLTDQSGSWLRLQDIELAAHDAAGREIILAVHTDPAVIDADSAGQLTVTARPAYRSHGTSATIPVRLAWGSTKRSARRMRRIFGGVGGRGGRATRTGTSILPRPSACRGASPPEPCGPAPPSG